MLATYLLRAVIHLALLSVLVRSSAAANSAAADDAGSIVEYSIPTAASYPTAIAAYRALRFTEAFANKIGRTAPAGAVTECGNAVRAGGRRVHICVEFWSRVELLDRPELRREVVALLSAAAALYPS